MPFIEYAADESEAIIQDLFARLYARSNRYEHRWRNGDLVVWDNLGVQHARAQVRPGVHRTLQRVEIGSKSYLEQMPDLAYAGLESGPS